jgi:hypothetical protein
MATSGLKNNQVIQLQGGISSPCDFLLTSVLPDLILNPKVLSINYVQGTITVKSVRLEFKSSGICKPGSEYKVSVTGNIRLIYASHSLQFKTWIYMTPTSAKVRALLKGPYHVPIINYYFAIENVELRLDQTPSAPTVLTATSDFKLGRHGNDHEIKGNATMGIDLTNTELRYICGNIAEFTVASLLKALDVDTMPPAVIRDMGFPEGVVVSHATLGVGAHWPVPSDCRPITPGFSLKGVFHFLGYKIPVNTRIPQNEITIQGSYQPINLMNGNIAIYKSASEKSVGPALLAFIKTTSDGGSDQTTISDVNISISGYMELVGGLLSAEVMFFVTENEVSAQLKGHHYLFEVSLKLYGDYREKLPDVKFKVQGKLESGELENIGKKVEEKLRKAANRATSLINDLQGVLNSAKAVLDTARSLFENKQQIFDSTYRRVQNFLNSLNSARQTVNALCRIETCSDNCIGCPGFKSCCSRWTCHPCTYWRSCCTTVPDPGCLARNAACRPVRDAAHNALSSAPSNYQAAQRAFQTAKTD